MKTILLAVSLLFLGQMLFAQKFTDPKGNVIVDARGIIYQQGMKVGLITKDSIIKNAKGKKIAFLRPGGALEDANGKIIGQMGKDGRTYYSANGQLVLQVKSDTNSETCDILDANGKVVGNVHNNYKQMACVVHCFTNRMDAKTHKKIKS